jgi:hypothetical protein
MGPDLGTRPAGGGRLGRILGIGGILGVLRAGGARCWAEVTAVAPGVSEQGVAGWRPAACAGAAGAAQARTCSG